MKNLITVYFDGKCGLCRREIDYYKSISPKNIFIWHDIMANNNILNDTGIPLKAALMTLHVKDELGCWHKGTDAFIVIWSHLPKIRFKLLSKLLSLPVIHSISCWAYHQLSKSRFEKNGYCDLG